MLCATATPKYEAFSPFKYVYTKSEKTNIRSGPGVNYPVIFSLLYKSEPLVVRGKFDQWFDVCDFQNSCGYLHKSVVSWKKRFGILLDAVDLFSIPTASANSTGTAEKLVRFEILYCNVEWCKCRFVQENNKLVTKWIKRSSSIWGLNDGEFQSQDKLKLLLKIIL